MTLRTAAAVIALLATLVYGNAAANGFALDDEFIILENDVVHGIDRLDDALSSPYWPTPPGRVALYRPITSASFALEWDLWGPGRPAGFHVTNVLLHALVSVLVLLLLARLAAPAGGPGRAGAVAGGALFAVHPVHTEAVANLVGRGELLAAAFFLLAALVYLRGPRVGGEGGSGAFSGSGAGASGRSVAVWAAALGALYFLSVGSKETGVTLPAVLLLLEAVRPGIAKGGWRGWARRAVARWPAYAATVVALAGYLALRVALLGSALGNGPAPFLASDAVGARVLTAVSVWPEYVRLMLYPAHLVADYSPGVLMPQTSLTIPVVAGLMVGAGALALVVLTWRRAPMVAAGVGWFAVTVLPVSNLPFPTSIMLAERTLYLPSVGVSLGLAGVVRLAIVRRRAWVRPLAVAGALVLVLASARTWTRTPVWTDTATVVARLTAAHPESFRVQWLMAGQAFREGRADEALARLGVAVELMPRHYQLRLQYGRALLEAGWPGEAAPHLEAARALVPEYPEAHILLAAALARQGNWQAAARIAGHAVERFPGRPDAWHQLALARDALGDYTGALSAREASLRVAGEHARWHDWVHAAELNLRLGREAAGEEALRRARATAPRDAGVPTLDALRAAVAAGGPGALPHR